MTIPEDPQEIIGAAVGATLSVLKAVAAHGASVKRVIIVSSTATIGPGLPGVYDETTWNDACIEQVNKLGKSAVPLAKYAASKTLAERTAWEWYEANKATLPWDLVVILPVWVFGPPVNPVKALSDLAPSMRIWYGNVVKAQSSDALTKPQ